MAVTDQTERTPRGDDKREKILAAALDLFAERGFHGTPVPEVATRAKVGAGTIYRYFESKEALVNVLYRQLKNEMLAHTASDLDFTLAPRQQWHRLFRRIVSFAEAQPLAFAFLELHHHAPYLDEESRAIETRVMGMAVAFLEQTRAAGLTRAEDPQVLIALVWGGIIRLIRSFHEGLLQADEATLERFEALCWEALRA